MILVGMDFSDDAWEALAEAREFSRSTGMPVEVLFVSEYGQESEWAPNPDQRRAMEAAGLPLEALRVRRGVPWLELARFARELEARLIVAGRRGDSGFQPFALGSTAQRLATSTRDPLLLVSRSGKRTKKAIPAGPEEASNPAGQAREKHGPPTRSGAS